MHVFGTPRQLLAVGCKDGLIYLYDVSEYDRVRILHAMPFLLLPQPVSPPSPPSHGPPSLPPPLRPPQHPADWTAPPPPSSESPSSSSDSSSSSSSSSSERSYCCSWPTSMCARSRKTLVNAF